MESARRKWLVLAGLLTVLAGGTLFLLKLSNQSSAPSQSVSKASAPKAGADNPDHELKMLAVELEKKPGHVPVLLRMAQLERDKGELDKSAAHLRQVLEHEPSNADAHLELGRILYERGDAAGAISETAKILEKQPKQVDALYNLGAIYANTGNAARARAYWTQAVQADPAADSGKKAREALAKLGGS
jgi:Flp pilus assembly protein TadD